MGVLKKKIPRLKAAVFVLVVLLNIYWIFWLKHLTLDLDISPNTNPSSDIMGEVYVGQSFVAGKDALCRIDLMLGTHGRNNDREIIFELSDAWKEENPIVVFSFNAAQVENNLFFPIEFSPISDSKGKKYHFKLSSSNSEPFNAVCVWMNERDIYSEGQFFLSGEPTPGELIFRTYSKRPIFLELGRIGRNYSGIWANKAVLVIVIILFFGAQIFILFRLLNLLEKALKSREKEQHE